MTHSVSRHLFMSICSAALMISIGASLDGNAQALSETEPSGWNRVRVLDLNSMPWTSPPKRPAGWKFKNIHTIESTGGGAELVFIPPKWSTNSPRHYDKENGWYYFLDGDSAVLYYKSPQDQVGTLYHNRAGTLFYGVEGAIHYFDERTVVPEGCVLLSWHDRRPAIQPVPFESKDTTLNGHPWPSPKMIHTQDLSWENSSLGYLLKNLYDVGGAKLEMRYYPPGWVGSENKQYASFDRWMYVLDGSLYLKIYEGLNDINGKVIAASRGQVVEIPAKAIWGGTNGMEVKDIGAWLLVWSEQSGTITEVPSNAVKP